MTDLPGQDRAGATSWSPIRRGLTFSELRAVLLFIGVAAAACLMPAQADTYWHLRAGQELFQTGHVPLIETYSHTARGRPWPNHEWLWQGISYALYRIGGMPLLEASGAACATAACLMAYRLMRARPSVSFALALVGIPLASLVWALRPQVASLLLLVVLVRLVVSDRYWVIPLLFVVWANLHGAVALGGVVLIAATAVAWWSDDRRRLRRLLLVTPLAAVATAVTPMGTELWTFIGTSMARSRQNQILEWLPAYPRGPLEIGFWLGTVALLGAVLRRWRRLDSWGDRVVVVTALALFPLAARAIRNISPFFLLWMPAMSRLVGPDARLRIPRWWRRSGRGRPLSPQQPDLDREHPRLNLILASLAGLAAVLAVGLAWARPASRLGWAPLAPAAITAVSACPGPLYNRYNDGGYLIWFAPRVPVFVDSRQDPYPASLLSAHAAAERTGDYQDLFRQHHIGCAALPPTSSVARRLLADGWIQTYADADWLVLRPAPGL